MIIFFGVPRTALVMALQGSYNSHVVFWGICCSSWVHLNSGTSHRDYLNPHGHPLYPSVQLANRLVARLGFGVLAFGIFLWDTVDNYPQHSRCFLCGLHPERCILVILITVSLGGHIVLENPGSSLIWLHDRFQWMLESLGSLGTTVPFAKGFEMFGNILAPCQ